MAARSRVFVRLKAHPLVRIAALALCVSLAPQGTVLAGTLPALSSIDPDPRTASAGIPPVPPELGRVEKLAVGAGTPVLLIQDAHAVPEAQEHIAKILEYLAASGRLGAAAIEGVSTGLDPALFRAYPDRALLERVISRWISDGDMTGPTAASLRLPSSIPFRGLEDHALLEEGYRLWIEADRSAAGTAHSFELVTQKIRQLEKRYYSARQLEFETACREPLASPASLSRCLSAAAQILPLSKDGVVARFARAIQPSIPDSGIRSELRTAANFIASQLRVRGEAGSLAAFHGEQQAYDTAVTGAAEWSARLLHYEKKAGVRAPGERWRRYAVSFPSVEEFLAPGFLQSLDLYLERTRESGLDTPEKRKTARLSRRLRLLSALRKVSLTRRDWAEINSDRGLRDAAQAVLPAAFLFYENAVRRDAYFLERIRSTGGKAGQTAPLAVIAGGFHIEALSAALEAEGRTFAVITPRISEVPAATNYREAMRGEVRWRREFPEAPVWKPYSAFARAFRNDLLAAAGPDRSSALDSWQRALSSAPAQRSYVDELIYTAEREKALDGLRKRTADLVRRMKQLSSDGVLETGNLKKLFAEAGLVEILKAAALETGAELTAPAEAARHTAPAAADLADFFSLWAAGLQDSGAPSVARSEFREEPARPEASLHKLEKPHELPAHRGPLQTAGWLAVNISIAFFTLIVTNGFTTWSDFTLQYYYPYVTAAAAAGQLALRMFQAGHWKKPAVPSWAVIKTDLMINFPSLFWQYLSTNLEIQDSGLPGLFIAFTGGILGTVFLLMDCLLRKLHYKGNIHSFFEKPLDTRGQWLLLFSVPFADWMCKLMAMMVSQPIHKLIPSVFEPGAQRTLVLLQAVTLLIFFGARRLYFPIALIFTAGAVIGNFFEKYIFLGTIDYINFVNKEIGNTADVFLEIGTAASAAFLAQLLWRAIWHYRHVGWKWFFLHFMHPGEAHRRRLNRTIAALVTAGVILGPPLLHGRLFLYQKPTGQVSIMAFPGPLSSTRAEVEFLLGWICKNPTFSEIRAGASKNALYRRVYDITADVLFSAPELLHRRTGEYLEKMGRGLRGYTAVTQMRHDLEKMQPYIDAYRSGDRRVLLHRFFTTQEDHSALSYIALERVIDELWNGSPEDRKLLIEELERAASDEAGDKRLRFLLADDFFKYRLSYLRNGPVIGPIRRSMIEQGLGNTGRPVYEEEPSDLMKLYLRLTRGSRRPSAPRSERRRPLLEDEDAVMLARMLKTPEGTRQAEDLLLAVYASAAADPGSMVSVYDPLARRRIRAADARRRLIDLKKRALLRYLNTLETRRPSAAGKEDLELGLFFPASGTKAGNESWGARYHRILNGPVGAEIARFVLGGEPPANLIEKLRMEKRPFAVERRFLTGRHRSAPLTALLAGEEAPALAAGPQIKTVGIKFSGDSIEEETAEFAAFVQAVYSIAMASAPAGTHAEGLREGVLKRLLLLESYPDALDPSRIVSGSGSARWIDVAMLKAVLDFEAEKILGASA